HFLAARLPPDDRRRARAQRADADRGLSQRLSRFRSRQPANSRGRRKLRRRRPRARPCWWRPRGARRFAKARRGVAGAVSALPSRRAKGAFASAVDLAFASVLSRVPHSECQIQNRTRIISLRVSLWF